MSEQSKAPDVIWMDPDDGYDVEWDDPKSDFYSKYLSETRCNALIQAFAKDVSAHLLNTQLAFESKTDAEEWVKGNNSGVKACAAVVRHFSPDETQAAYDAAISDARAEMLTEAMALFTKDETLTGCVVLHRLEKLRGKSDG